MVRGIRGDAVSDARPITNVTEYVCGSCWNGFGASDPGVRSTGGTLTCPHCGHMQAAITDLTAAVRAAPGRPDEAAVADDADDEVGVGFERPSSSPAFAPNPAASAAAKVATAAASAAASGGAEVGAFHHLDLGSDDDGPVDFAAEFASQFGDDQDPGPAHAVDTPASVAAAAAEEPQPAIAGEFELSVDTEEDTPVADFVDPEAAEPAPARPGGRRDAFDDTVQAKVPAALASIRHADTEDATPIAEAQAAAAASKRPSSSMRPALKTAEELLAYLDSTEDDDSMDMMFGSTMSTLEAVDADAPAPVVVRGAGAVGEDDDTAEVEAFASGDTTRMRRIDGPTGAAAPDPSDDPADDEPDFDMVSENTAPDLEATTLEVEPAEWKLRAPPGLTYNFHSVDALLGWASNRSTDGLQVSIDGTVWRPVAPFLDALRAGHRGRKAFALAQVPEMVANMSAEDSRSALDDIRDVDVRDEVIRSLEARANGGVAALAGASRTRQVRPAVPAMDATDLGIDIDDDTLPASSRAKARVSSTMPAAKAADVPGAVETAATGAGLGPSTRPSGKTPLRATGRTPAVKAGGRGDRPATGTQPAVAGGRGPSATKHTPVVRKDEPKSKVVWLVLGVVLLALGAIAGLHAAGIVKLPLP